MSSFSLLEGINSLILSNPLAKSLHLVDDRVAKRQLLVIGHIPAHIPRPEWRCARAILVKAGVLLSNIVYVRIGYCVHPWFRLVPSSIKTVSQDTTPFILVNEKDRMQRRSSP